MKINIIGVRGSPGRFHRPIFEADGHEVIISGRDSKPGIEEATKQTDITIISVPISSMEGLIREIAPHAKALMSFAELQVWPIKWMLGYTNKDYLELTKTELSSNNVCEAGGLHPLYKEGPLKGRAAIYCIGRQGERCSEILKSLVKAGVDIKEMTPEKHDSVVGRLQEARTLLHECYGRLVFSVAGKEGLSSDELYKISSPPTKLCLDVIARQIAEENALTHKDRRKYNPSVYDLPRELKDCLAAVAETDKGVSYERLREFFGDGLGAAQERAKKIMDLV